jgi:ribosomal protein L40E
MPQHSVRAADHLCRAITLVPHPLAARLLLDPGEFLAAAQRFWREARFHKGWQSAGTLPLEAVALECFFKSSNTDIATLEKAPERDHTSVSYCPRCLAQFQLAAGECRDCEGVELRAFDGARVQCTDYSEAE